VTISLFGLEAAVLAASQWFSNRTRLEPRRVGRSRLRCPCKLPRRDGTAIL